eukprot:NODE_843_length_3758_cov_0.336977.p4 type:complete len:103 gc:universal NODE_843_length_3758_cov_0.336977:629-937(+)
MDPAGKVLLCGVPSKQLCTSPESKQVTTPETHVSGVTFGVSGSDVDGLADGAGLGPDACPANTIDMLLPFCWQLVPRAMGCGTKVPQTQVENSVRVVHIMSP